MVETMPMIESHVSSSPDQEGGTALGCCELESSLKKGPTSFYPAALAPNYEPTRNMGTWEQTATAKRDSVFSLIPAEWRIENLPSREEQRDVTGKYIHQFLSPTEIEITETDAVGIAAKTTTGAWSAESVTTAFCHRAALAHQLVRKPWTKVGGMY